MAILSKIRSKTVVLIVIIALALFAFVLADVIRQGGFTSNKSQNVIGVVGDQEIKRKSFARQVENVAQGSRGRTSTIDAVNRVWESRVNNMILEQQFDELGLEISTDLILEKMKPQLSRDQRFTDADGNFSKARVREYVASIRNNDVNAFEQWQEFEKNIEVQAVRNTYFNLVKAGAGVTELEAKQIYEQENSQYTFDFVRIPFNKADKVEVTKSDIKSYMKEHQEKYEQEAKRNIRYVLYEEKPSAKDMAEAREEMVSLINGNDEYPESFKSTDDMKAFLSTYSDQPFQDEFKFKYQLNDSLKEQLTALKVDEVLGPYKKGDSWRAKKIVETKQVADSTEVKHILVTFKEAGVDRNVQRTKEEAKKLADSLMGIIEQDEDKFGELAKEFSSDRQSKSKGGKLGKVAYGRFFEELNDFIFENQEGFKGSLESQYGYHIVQILDKNEPKKAIKIATLVREVAPSEETLNNLFKEASKFELATKEKEFETVADERTKEIRKAKELKELDEGVAGLGDQRNIVRWSFDENTQLKDIKRFDIDKGYVIAQVTDKQEEGLKPVEEVADEVTPILEQEQQAKAIKEKITDSSDLEAIGEMFGVTKQRASAVDLKNPVIPGGGKEPKVVGLVSGLDKDEVSSPVKGNNGVYVAQLIKKEEAMELASYFGPANSMTKERIKNISNPNSSPVIKALKESLEIEDRRTRFY